MRLGSKYATETLKMKLRLAKSSRLLKLTAFLVINCNLLVSCSEKLHRKIPVMEVEYNVVEYKKKGFPCRCFSVFCFFIIILFREGA